MEFKPRAERRVERIRRYAQNRYEIRVKYGIPGDEKSDWELAEALVDAELRRNGTDETG